MTPSKKIQHELISLDETRYRNLFENNRDGIYITALDGSIIDMNKAALQITGFKSKKEFAQKNVSEHYSNPKQRARFQREIKKHGFVKDFEVNLRKRTGEEIICLLTSSAITDAKGKVIGYQGIIRDVTEQKKQQQIQETLLKITEAATSSGDLKALLKNIQGAFTPYQRRQFLCCTL